MTTFVATCLLLVASAASSDMDAAERASRLELFPRDRLYQRHVADPLDPGMGVEWLVFDEVDVPDSGDARFQLSLGGIFGLVRLRPSGGQEGGVELGILAGFVGQFDADRGYDNLGWDGFYGLVLSTSRGGPWALRGGIKHTSSHLGDEYVERTGRRRIDYTREELAVAVSRRLEACCRLYVEGAWGYELRNRELQEPGRVQAGLEVEPPPSLWSGRVGWYVALDVGGYEESDWQVDWSARAGLALPAPGRTWRVALSWRRGRVPLGEHSQHRESYFGAGLLLDL
ncbi:MAG TPA: DUF1207 domain-containing protein [Thermoanaerobaculia bacterium]|nr:DUF1207 domain-containing protein [Thermoanaerobaculia bacterium]